MAYPRLVDGETRSKHGWVVLSYFFLGALLGLLVATVSAVVAVSSLMIDGSGKVVAGAAMKALVGGVVLYIHLTEGLKRSRIQAHGEQVARMAAASGDAPSPPQSSPPPPPAAGVDAPPLWPSAVYFRVAALVGLIAAVSGAVGMCEAMASALFGGSDVPDPFSGYPGVGNNGEAFFGDLLVTGVGLLVMWWHLNEAKKRGQ